MVDIGAPHFPSAPKHLYKVYLKRTGKTSPYPAKYFVIIRKGCAFTTSHFAGVGYWTDQDPRQAEKAPAKEEVQEIIIPWNDIAYIENTQYVYKG